MWYADLTRCDTFIVEVDLLAVGWLTLDREFPKGHVDLKVYHKLVELSKDPWQPIVMMGTHACDLCRFKAEAIGVKNLFIPHKGKIYLCPELICHYVNAHHYAPPEVFQQAVLDCKPMKSMAYLKEILNCGGAALVNPPSH